MKSMTHEPAQQICPYCHTSDCGIVFNQPEPGMVERTEICREREHAAHSFFLGEMVLLQEYDPSDSLCSAYEQSGEQPSAALVALEREGRPAKVIAISSMYPGSDQVTVEVDGERTIIWNKFLVHADPQAAAKRREPWIIPFGPDEGEDENQGMSSTDLAHIADQFSSSAYSYIEQSEWHALTELSGVQGSLEGLACRMLSKGNPVDQQELRELAKELSQAREDLHPLQLRSVEHADPRIDHFRSLAAYQGMIEGLAVAARAEPRMFPSHAFEEIADQLGVTIKGLDALVDQYLGVADV